MDERKSFVLYTDYLEHIEHLNDDQTGKLFKAILTYTRDGKTPKFKGALAMAFSFIKVQLDRDFGKYNEIIEKRREAGRKGGQKRAEQSQANQANANFAKANSSKSKQSQANQADTDNVTVNDTDNVTVNDNVSVINNNTAHAPDTNCDKIPFAEFVTMTNAEYNALIEKYGESDTKRMIEILDNHKGMTGKTYNSDYRAILSWVWDRLNKEKQNSPDSLHADSYNHAELEVLTRGN